MAVVGAEDCGSSPERHLPTQGVDGARSLTPRGVAWRWLVAALCAAWIITILPALPLPYCRQVPRLFGSFPDWRDRLLGAGARIGAAIAALVWLAWGYATGALRYARLGSGFIPLSARAWFIDVMHWGELFGMLLTATIPPWALATLGRILSHATQPPSSYQPSAGPPIGSPRLTAPVRRATDPSLVIAGGWSLTLGGAFVGLVSWQLLHPVPSWLMMPPVRGASIDAQVPPSEWCAYSFHTRARECETALGEAAAQHAFSINGFGYAGARCVPLSERVVPSLRATTIERVNRALGRALAGRAAVRRDHRIGDEQVDVAVLAHPSDGSVLLALDVGEGREDAHTEARAARLAAAGVPDYWRVELYPNRDPLTMDMLRTWKDPDVAAQRYAAVSAASRNADLLLRLAALADVRVPIDELLPVVCERAASQAAGEGGPPGVSGTVHTPTRDAAAFVLDRSAPPPVLTFDGVSADGVASGLRFNATSVAPQDGFDPASTGLSIGIRGPFINEDVVEAMVPAGGSWRRVSGAHPSWTYRDPAGSVGGITEVTVRSIDGQRLAWEIGGARGRYRVLMDDLENWGSLGVHLGFGPNSQADTCGAVFFRTAGSGARCLLDPPDTLTCRGPDRASDCSGDDSDALVRCAVQQVAAAEEVFFTGHGRYFGGNCADLPDVALPQGLVCEVTGTAMTFVVTTTHPSATVQCTWTSNPAAGSPNLACS